MAQSYVTSLGREMTPRDLLADTLAQIDAVLDAHPRAKAIVQQAYEHGCQVCGQPTDLIICERCQDEAQVPEEPYK